MTSRFGLILPAVFAATALALAPALPGAAGVRGQDIESLPEGQKPKNNMWTRSATLYLSQAQTNPNPEEKRQRYTEALQVSLDGIENEPENPQSYLQAGQAYIGLGDYAGADSMLALTQELYPRYVVDIDPIRENAWVISYNLAIGQLNQANSQEAIQLWERAHLIFKKRPEAALNLGQTYANMGESEKAIEYYKQALEVMQSDLYEQQDSATKAIWSENEEIAAFNVAQLLATAGRNQEAADAYVAFIERNPDHVAAVSNLGVVLVNMEMPDSAMALYRKLLDRDDLSASDYFSTGIGLFQAEAYDLSAVAFRKTTEIIPDHRDATYNLAQTLYLTESFDALLTVSQHLVELDEYNNNGYRFLAQALVKSGDEQEAVRVLERMDALPFEVTDLQLSPRAEGGGMVSGRVENLKAPEGAPVAIRVHFLSSDGSEIGAADVDVQMPAVESAQPWQAEVEAEQPVAAYWYEVTNEVPTVEPAPAEPDTTSKGNSD